MFHVAVSIVHLTNKNSRWPVSGSTENDAVPSLANAKTYWDQVGCNKLFGKINTWWYTLQDAFPGTPNPSFGVVGTTLSTTPLFDLSCSGASSAVPASASRATTASENAASAQAGGTAGAEHEASAVEATSKPAGSNAAPPAHTSVVSSLATSVSNGETVTFLKTDTITLTSCSNGCPKATSAPASQPPTSKASASPNTLITKTSALPSTSSGSCPANLNGVYEYPHLIVHVNKDEPTKASGTSFNGTFSPTISSIFNFDIPASDAGKTCTVVFLLPTQGELTTSAFSLSGSGGLDVALLSEPATEQTTFETVPKVDKDYGGPESVVPGNEYVIASFACPAGERIGVEVTATGGLSLDYFQDYNPSPIGLYITVC